MLFIRFSLKQNRIDSGISNRKVSRVNRKYCSWSTRELAVSKITTYMKTRSQTLPLYNISIEVYTSKKSRPCMTKIAMNMTMIDDGEKKTKDMI